MWIFIWALFKNASLPWCLRTGEDALARNGFAILAPAGDNDLHVIGHRANPEVFVTIVCTRLGQSPTSVVVHALSQDQATASTVAEQIRDEIKRAVSLEGDVVLNPVNE
jgi:hypothetical protein